MWAHGPGTGCAEYLQSMRQTVGDISEYVTLLTEVVHCSYQIEHAFAFSAELFHACLTTSFIIAYVDCVLVEGLKVQDVIQDLLVVSPRLAMHASIIHIHVTNTFRRRFPTISEYTQGLARIPGDEVSTIMSIYTFFMTTIVPSAKPYLINVRHASVSALGNAPPPHWTRSNSLAGNASTQLPTKSKRRRK